jgi:acetyl-CoA carboxylase biotin carboxyl carrier protein
MSKEREKMKEITASMAGMVLNILVSAGENISAGQVVIVLESMKMEIPVESAVSGKVAEVKAAIGDFVNEGDLLITVE